MVLLVLCTPQKIKSGQKERDIKGSVQMRMMWLIGLLILLTLLIILFYAMGLNLIEKLLTGQ